MKKLFHRSTCDDSFFVKGLTSFNSRSVSGGQNEPHKVFVSTWNVGGKGPTSDLDLSDWLDTNNNSYDIYVIGFQEIVPLTAGNILGRENSRISMEWNSLIKATLNKSLSIPQRSQGVKQKVHPLKHGRHFTDHIFCCIITKKMVGIQVSVWVRGDLEPYIRYPSFSCIGCGILGCLGNKGAVSVSFLLHETSFCIVCCHLASGGKEGDVKLRNCNVMEILERTSFPRGLPDHGLPVKILDHQIILLGDLNYRIALPEAKTRLLVQKKEWDILLAKDQLRYEMSEGRPFEGWYEGTITFFPTYKYYLNLDAYYGCADDRGEKRRAPAWCDRILWYGRGLKQIQYDRSEMRISDHRPVRAIFIADVKARKESNSLGSFFSLGRVATNFDVTTP